MPGEEDEGLSIESLTRGEPGEFVTGQELIAAIEELQARFTVVTQEMDSRNINVFTAMNETAGAQRQAINSLSDLLTTHANVINSHADVYGQMRETLIIQDEQIKWLIKSVESLQKLVLKGR